MSESSLHSIPLCAGAHFAVNSSILGSVLLLVMNAAGVNTGCRGGPLDAYSSGSKRQHVKR